MQSSPGCPEAAVLARYHEQKLGGDAVRPIAEHVKGCGMCQRRLARLDLVSRSEEGDATVAERDTEHTEDDAHPTEETAGSLTPADTKRGKEPEDKTKAAAQQLKKGANVGRYVIRDVLGVGGMGAVYSAYDPELNRRVALKVLRSRKRSADQHLAEDRSRLMREAQAMAQLSHPNIVTVFDVGSFEGEIYIAMELVQGTTLTRWLSEKKRGWKEVAQLFALAGRGLAAAHAAGLVHRDFKPDNVLVGKDGRVRVMDFGLARPTGGADDDASEASSAAESSDAKEASEASLLNAPLTRKGILVGTPVYMAPEQFLNEPIDARADQFAFCVALYEALYGELPFQGDNMEDLAHAIVAASVARLPKRRAVPLLVHGVLRRGMRSEPKDRFPSMDALLRALDFGIRFRTRAASVTAAAALGTFIVVAKPFQNAEKICPDPVGELGGVWDPPREKAMSAAFSATKVIYAQDTFRSVQLAFKDYARDWAAAKREACLATRVRREQTEDALELKYGCLDQRRNELRELVGLFLKIDTALLERAVSAAASLSPITGCADLAALSMPPSGPAEADLRAKVAEQRDKLASAAARGHAAKYKDALALADGVAAAAKQLKFRPLEAEALVLRGRMQTGLAEYDAAENTLFDAVAAAQAARLYGLAAEALIALTRVVGFWEARTDDGRHLGELAAGLIEGLGNPDELSADLQYILGWVAYKAGDYSEASSKARRALAIRERLHPNSIKVAEALSQLGSASNALARDDEAIVAYKRAAAIIERLYGKNHPQLAALLNNFGMSYHSMKRYDEANALYQRALRIWEAAFGEANFLNTNALNNLAITFTAQGRYDQALGFARRAISITEVAQGKESPNLPALLGTLGEALLAAGQSDEALNAFERALRLRDKTLKPNHVGSANELTGIGETYLAMGKPRQALEPLERAVKLREQSPGFPGKLAKTRFALARAIMSTGGDQDRALALASSARDVYADPTTGDQAQRQEVASWIAKHSRQ